MFCPKCGKENSDGTKFCASCGTNIEIVAGAKHITPLAGGVSDPMTFGKSISTCLSKFFDFKGRASRPEYWWFYLFTILVSWGSMLVDHTQILSGLVSLIFIFPASAAATRRLHDTNRSGWWQLLYFTIIGIIPVTIWLASKSSDQENEYGSPL
jgi:uncharacterized membrane protein YhaH (DUF805 family)